MVDDEFGSTGVNGYHCSTCDGITLTYHLDRGVTPMFLACRATPDCDGQAVSLMYPDPPLPEHIASQPRYAWYKPGPDEYADLSDAMRDHVDRGGLCLRDTPDPAP